MIAFEDKKDLMGKILIVMSLLLLGVLFAVLFNQPFLSADEWFTKSLINMNLEDMMKIIAIDVHPPLYYFIDKAVVAVMSPLNVNGMISVKIASIIPYFVILALSLTLIRRKYGWYAGGMVAFSLMSMGIFLTYYMTARMYTWALLFAILGFICAGYILEKPCLKNWIALSAFSVLGVYTVYISAVSSIVLYMILFAYFLLKDKSQIKNFLISCALKVALFVPWIFIMFRHTAQIHDDYWIKMESFNQIINTYTFVFHNFFDIPAVSYIFLIILIAIAAYLIKRFWDTRDIDDFYVLSGVMVFFGTVTLFVVASLVYKPIIVDRILIPSMGIFWFALSIALSRLKSESLLAIVTVAIVILGCANFAGQFDDISAFHDETVTIEKTLHRINTNDSIVVFIGMQKYVRFHEYLNNTQQYYMYSINNQTADEDYVALLGLDNSTFKIPENLSKNRDKKVYVILDWKNNSLDNLTQIKAKQYNKTGILHMERLSLK